MSGVRILNNNNNMKVTVMSTSASKTTTKHVLVDKKRIRSVSATTTPLMGTLHGSDIVKSGYLHIKRPPSKQQVKIRIKAWQKRFFVLRDESFRDGTTMLEIFDSHSDWIQDPLNAEQYAVDLRTVSHVEEYRDSKRYPYAFVVTRGGRSPLVLGTDSELEMKEWLMAIKVLADKAKAKDSKDRRPSCPSLVHLNVRTPQGMRKGNTYSPPPTAVPPFPQGSKSSLPSSKSTSPPTAPRNVNTDNEIFPITMQPTESSEKIGLHGDYTLKISDNELVLSDAVFNEVIKWPVIHVKKFKSETVGTGLDLITLEASQNCGKSSGVFTFTTYCGPEIFVQVKMANRKLSSDVASRHLEQQMDQLRNVLSLPSPIARAPSAPCLSQVSRQAMPLPPVPCNGHAQRKPSTASSSSGSSGSSVREILEQTVNPPEKRMYMGSGYLDLLEDQSNENGLKADVSLDDLVEPLSDEESSGSEDHSRQDSGFIDTFDAMKIQREVMKKCLESTPPPLPPRDWSPVKRGLNSSPRTSPLSCSPVEKETVVTHL